MKDILKSIIIIFYPDEILIHPNVKTVDGMWMGKGISIILKKDVNNDEFYESIIKMFNESIKNVPHPKNFSESSKIFFNGIGKKSNKKYMENAKLISIKMYNDCYEIIPTKNGGIKGDDRGFTPLNEKNKKMDLEIGKNKFVEEVYSAIEDCV